MTPQRRAVERLSIKLGLAVVVLTLAFFLLPVIWTYLSPFIIALPFAAMIQPTAHFLERKFHLKHSPAVLIPVLIMLLVMLAFLVWFFTFSIQRISELMQNPGALIGNITGTARQALESLLSPMDAYLPSGEEVISSVDRAWAGITAWGTDVASQLAAILLSMATSVPEALIYINFLFMGLFFIAKDYDRILSFLPHRRKTLTDSSAARLTNSAISGAIGYLKVQLIYGMLTLVGSAIYWTAFGNSYAIIIALGAAILEFVPLVGNGAVYLTWALVSLILGDAQGVIQPLALWLGLFIIRRITEPKIMSQTIGISPLLSLVSMFVGMTAGGIIGLILGPVLMTVAVAFFRGGYIQSVREDASLLYHTMHRRWQDDNLILPPEQTVTPVQPIEKDEPPAEPPAE